MDDVRDVRRREIKYRISLGTATRAKRYMDGVLHGDTHSGADGYLVRSLYFDTVWNDDFEEKEYGIENRRKIRLRVYSPTDETAKLELKQKEGAWQHKQSLTVPRSIALRLAVGDYEPLAQMQQPLAQKLYRFMREELYQPKCIVQYRRDAFIVPTNDIRITFDYSITATEGSLDLYGDGASYYPVEWPDGVTLEVKYNHFLLSYVKDILNGIEKVPVSYSKYTISRFLTHSES